MNYKLLFIVFAIALLAGLSLFLSWQLTQANNAVNKCVSICQTSLNDLAYRCGVDLNSIWTTTTWGANGAPVAKYFDKDHLNLD